MSKRKKKQLQSVRSSLLDYEIRPVTKSDKWCQRKLGLGKEPVGDAPFGYIITIPYLPSENMILDKVDGYIVRTKKHCGNLLLQVVKKASEPQYGVKSFASNDPNHSSRKRKNKKKFYRILHIRNFSKSQGKW